MDLPDDSVPIDVNRITDGYRIRFPTQNTPPSPIPVPNLTFREWLSYQPDHERCALLRFDLFDLDIHDVIQTLQSLEDYILVSDGGADFKSGSFGWILGTTDGHRLAQGSGAVFGFDPKSYRAEISGCRAGLLFLCHAVLAYCSSPMPAGRLHAPRLLRQFRFYSKDKKFPSSPPRPDFMLS